jgi:hypothetical protein
VISIGGFGPLLLYLVEKLIMKNLLLPLIFVALAGCFNQGDEAVSETVENSSSVVEKILEKAPEVDDEYVSIDDPKMDNNASQASYRLFTAESNLAINKEAVIPPQCYTKHEGQHNPCMICHQNYAYKSRPNYMYDAGLQSAYEFSEYGFTNRWENLFEDRRERIDAISDSEIVGYINEDNYTPLIKNLELSENWEGPIPKIDNLHLGPEAFDDDGFAKDGSFWVAFNYKPLPSTFWPTNGSTDDVMIRLPSDFRETSCAEGNTSKDTYVANLALLEISFQELERVSVPSIDESLICADVNADGIISNNVVEVVAQEYYFGKASQVEVAHMLYPQGTEFIHSVRYVGVDDNKGITVPPRMKELRYMVKTHFRSDAWLESAYGNEQQEKVDGLLPKYVYRPEGSANEFGWNLLGFIEDEEGRLRVQNREETQFCMGCHTTVGSTIDQTFAFARKVTGAAGWGYINTRGMADAPSKAWEDNEILEYLRAVGGGDEFRQNDEMLDKWFNPDGTVREDAVRAADVYTLISPSRERALALNKAYKTIVDDQDFHHGRDANLKPAVNVYREVDENSPVLPGEKTRAYDIRLRWD